MVCDNTMHMRPNFQTKKRDSFDLYKDVFMVITSNGKQNSEKGEKSL